MEIDKGKRQQPNQSHRDTKMQGIPGSNEWFGVIGHGVEPFISSQTYFVSVVSVPTTHAPIPGPQCPLRTTSVSSWAAALGCTQS